MEIRQDNESPVPRDLDIRPRNQLFPFSSLCVRVCVCAHAVRLIISVVTTAHAVRLILLVVTLAVTLVVLWCNWRQLTAHVVRLVSVGGDVCSRCPARLCR